MKKAFQFNNNTTTSLISIDALFSSTPLPFNAALKATLEKFDVNSPSFQNSAPEIIQQFSNSFNGTESLVFIEQEVEDGYNKLVLDNKSLLVMKLAAAFTVFKDAVENDRDSILEHNTYIRNEISAWQPDDKEWIKETAKNFLELQINVITLKSK